MVNLEPQAIVYRVTNELNGHSYVGFTTQGLKRRAYAHKRAARVGGGFGLHAAIRKYGEENFKFEEVFDFQGDVDLGLAYESELIDAEKPAYNIITGSYSWKSPAATETRRKQVMGVEFKRSNKGQKRTPEQCAVQTENLRKAWATTRKGFTHSTETKARISAKKKQNPTRYWLGKKRPQIGVDQGKKVICLNDGQVFDSIAAAERYYGIGKDRVGMVVRGKHKAANGLRFKFLGDA